MGLPSGTSVTSAWDADVTSSGTHWTAKNKSYNGTLAAGASVSFGFNGSRHRISVQLHAQRRQL